MRAAAMLEQIDALPRPKRESAVDQRDRELDLRECRAEMRRHVVRALVIVQIFARLWRDPRKICFEIGANLGRRVFLDEERGGGVAAEYRQQTFHHPLIADPSFDRVGDVDEALTAGVDGERGGVLAHAISNDRPGGLLQQSSKDRFEYEDWSGTETGWGGRVRTCYIGVVSCTTVVLTIAA